jgi:hypothetical protein
MISLHNVKIGNCKGNQTYKEFTKLVSKKEDERFQKFQDMTTKYLDEPTDGDEATSNSWWL